MIHNINSVVATYVVNSNIINVAEQLVDEITTVAYKHRGSTLVTKILETVYPLSYV